MYPSLKNQIYRKFAKPPCRLKSSNLLALYSLYINSAVVTVNINAVFHVCITVFLIKTYMIGADIDVLHVMFPRKLLT